MDRYQLLIDLGSEQPPLEEQYKTDNNLIEGCQSRVWLQADLMPDGTVRFLAESDALIVKGIVSLLVKVYSGHTPDEILDNEPYFVEAIGLKEHLSPTRSNGLVAMIKQMKLYALAFKSKNFVRSFNDCVFAVEIMYSRMTADSANVDFVSQNAFARDDNLVFFRRFAVDCPFETVTFFVEEVNLCLTAETV